MGVDNLLYQSRVCLILFPEAVRPEVCVLFFWLSFAPFLLPLLSTLVSLRRNNAYVNKIIACFIFLVSFLFFFSVGVDFFVNLLPHSLPRQLFWAIEEIGEISAISIAVIYNFNMLQDIRHRLKLYIEDPRI